MINGPMKVRELIAKLSEFDQNTQVLFYTEDEAFLPKGHSFRLMDAVEISQHDFEPVRGDDGIPSLKLEKTPRSTRMVIISLTSDI